jgi:hypothetical protein
LTEVNNIHSTNPKNRLGHVSSSRRRWHSATKEKNDGGGTGSRSFFNS